MPARALFRSNGYFKRGKRAWIFVYYFSDGCAFDVYMIVMIVFIYLSDLYYIEVWKNRKTIRLTDRSTVKANYLRICSPLWQTRNLCAQSGLWK